MLKRLFWLCVGIAVGVIAVTKARAYVKSRIPDKLQSVLFEQEPENLTLRTVLQLCKDFHTSRKMHEAQLNEKYARRSRLDI